MLISFMLLFLDIHIYRLHKIDEPDPMVSFIIGGSLWTLFLYGITELFSVFELLHFTPLLFAWSGFTVLLLLHLLMCKKMKTVGTYVIKCTKKLKSIKLISVLTIFFSLLILFLALKTVAYNWDSMTYHLSRICHWAQNGTISHYSTNIIRQVASPVLGEFINLHVYILSKGKDNFFNLLQYFSYLICAGMVYNITRKLQCRRNFCRIASLLYLSMPIAFAEALTTQVDNFATIWLLYFTYILLDFTDTDKRIKFDKDTVMKVWLLGLFVGFGYLTKPSVCVGMVVMVLWLLTVCIVRRDSVLILAKHVGIVSPTIILLILPEVLRNIKTFSAISAPIAGQRQLIGTINPFYICVNFLKNFCYNLPNIYIYNSDYFLTKIIEKVAGILRVELNDPSIAEDGRSFYMHVAPEYAHDTAINPVIVILMIVFIVLGIIKLRQKKLKNILLSYSFVSVFCFIVFCAVLRWEPYVTRYMSSYLALLCPMVALQLQNNTGEKLRNGLAGVICFVCITEICNMGIYHRNIYMYSGAGNRPFGYFTNRSNEYETYVNICQAIREHDFLKIGLKTGEDSYEYPLWQMLCDSEVRIEHVNVENQTAQYEDILFTPDCIIWIGKGPEEAVWRNGKEYSKCIEFKEGYCLLY